MDTARTAEGSARPATPETTVVTLASGEKALAVGDRLIRRQVIADRLSVIEGQAAKVGALTEGGGEGAKLATAQLRDRAKRLTERAAQLTTVADAIESGDAAKATPILGALAQRAKREKARLEAQATALRATLAKLD